MTLVGWAQIALVLVLVILCAIPLSKFIAGLILGERNFLTPALGPVESGFYRLAEVDPAREQDWFAYAIAMLAFTIAGFLSLLLCAMLFRRFMIAGSSPMSVVSFPTARPIWRRIASSVLIPAKS